MMKIVILGTAYPYRGGLATFNERLARQFQSEGHEVDIETFTLQYPSFLFPGKTQYSSEQSPQDLHIVRKVHSMSPCNWVRVGRQLKKMRPDMLICCYWMPFFAPAFGTICRVAKRNGITRCIALVHNMFGHEKSLLDKLFAPYFVHSQDAFVALSDAVVQQIHTLSDCPAIASPHPIYDHYGERMTKTQACEILSLPQDKDYILFFGLVRAYKGLDWLLDALAQVKDRLPYVRLLVVGEFYEDEHRYRQQIKDLHMEDYVLIVNEFVPDDDLRKYFGAADLIVQPYKSATQSGVTQVAFHFEKPMLVTRVGGLGEIVHDGKMGYAVEPKSEAIAQAIVDYFENHRQEAFTQYLRQEKQKYGWDKMTKAFMQLMDRVS